MRWLRGWPVASPGGAPWLCWPRRLALANCPITPRPGRRKRRSRSAAKGRPSQSRRRKSENTSSPAILPVRVPRRARLRVQRPHLSRRAARPAPRISAPGSTSAFAPAPVARFLTPTVVPASAQQLRPVAHARAATSFSALGARRMPEPAKRPALGQGAHRYRSAAAMAAAPSATLETMETIPAELPASRTRWFALVAWASHAANEILAAAAP